MLWRRHGYEFRWRAALNSVTPLIQKLKIM